MKFISGAPLLALIFVTIVLSRATTNVYAASTPALGKSASFAILSSSYINTSAGTILNGDLGYTTGSAVTPIINGTTHIADTTYNQAGLDQNTALTALATQSCTFTFPPGAVDLATDTTHGPLGIYNPGVYCTTATSAASIGTAGIALSGSGTYIFRINGALTTVNNSIVTLTNGASSCDVFWTPTAATTLGANTTFAGTILDAAGITIGSTVIWHGRALAFGGTVSTDKDTITVDSCQPVTTPTPTPKPTHFDFPSCKSKVVKPGDKAHFITGMHQIVGGSLLSGSDDVYSLKKGNYLQCFCPSVGNKGIQTDWLRTDQVKTGWFFINGMQWNLGNVNYAAKNQDFTCKTPHHH